MKDFTVENVLAALGEYTETGSGYKARCPAHDDSSPSLSISEGDNGKAVVCCHAGCTQDALMAKLAIPVERRTPLDHPSQKHCQSQKRKSQNTTRQCQSCD